MSVVTGITLHCKHEHRALKEIQKWLSDRGFPILLEVSKYYGGNKHPQINLFGGGYNYFPKEDFIEFTKKINWDNEENVVLIINPEEGGCRIFIR